VHFESAEAIVLDVFDLHDRDRLVTFLTREKGKKKGVASGARTKHSRFAGQLQPLAKVQITWFEKEGRDLSRLSSVELVRPARRLHEDLEGILTGSYLADHMLEFAQEDEASDLLFRLLDSALEALEAGVDRNLAARYFEAWVLRLTGIFPAPTSCPLCGNPLVPRGALLPRGGEGLICFDCAESSEGREGLKVGPEVLEFLLRLGRESLARMGQVDRTPPSAAVLRQSEEVCARIRRAFLQHELRSYDVIQQTRAGA
jgi:DNA repair protein RecO (recombination protein O)